MNRTTTISLDFRTLKSRASAATVIKLMMACNDLSLANQALTEWKSEQPSHRGSRQKGAGMYFVRAQLAHLHEGMKIIEAIRNDPTLYALVHQCDPQTQASFRSRKPFSQMDLAGLNSRGSSVRSDELFDKIFDGRFRHTRTSFGFHPFLQKDREENPLMVDTVCAMDVELLFYREPIPPLRFKFDLEGSGEDLGISISNPCQFDTVVNSLAKKSKLDLPVKGADGFQWEYDEREGKLHRLDFVMGDMVIDSTSDHWRSNARISSLHDLLGAQLIVQLRIPTIPPDEKAAEYRRSVKLGELLVRLPSGIVLRFDHDNLMQFRGDEGFAAYAFTFPQTFEELIGATRYDRFKPLNSHPDPL